MKANSDRLGQAGLDVADGQPAPVGFKPGVCCDDSVAL
jgi:hypothetical protein